MFPYGNSRGSNEVFVHLKSIPPYLNTGRYAKDGSAKSTSRSRYHTDKRGKQEGSTTRKASIDSNH
jgi:hypothetical protein